MNPGWGPFLAQTQAYRMVLVKTYINTERVGLVHTDRPNENDPPIRREVILAYCYPHNRLSDRLERLLCICARRLTERRISGLTRVEHGSHDRRDRGTQSKQASLLVLISREQLRQRADTAAFKFRLDRFADELAASSARVVIVGSTSSLQNLGDCRRRARHANQYRAQDANRHRGATGCATQAPFTTWRE